MLLRNKSTNEQYHVPSGVGKALIQGGLAEEVVAAAPKQTPKTNWSASEGRHAGIDYQYPPYVYVNCSTCNQRQWVENPKAFAFRHCGVAEQIPNTVQAQYEALVRAYKARSKKKEPALTLDPAVVDRQVMAARGIKTREELLQQHRLLNEAGRKKG